MGTIANQPAMELKLSNQCRTLQIPEDLCVRAEKWLHGRFANVEELVVFTLQQLVDHDGTELDRQEEEMIQQRLKDLGYL